MAEQRKNFKLIDAILTLICVVFVVEAAAPAAAIGNSQYFWWIFLILTFLLPYALIAAELGTAYEDEGGLYDWVKRAYGRRVAARVAWYYWVNFPLWMASLAIMCPQLIGLLFNIPHISTFWSIVIELFFIWVVVIVSLFPISDSKWILNGSAVVKVTLAVLVGVLGIIWAIQHGMATHYTFASLFPKLEFNSLKYISVILFNFLGFEVLATFLPAMRDPKKDFPKAILVGGAVIAAIYLFSAFGISAAIPSDQISSDSLMTSVQVLTGSPTGWLVKFAALLFLLSLMGNMIAWSLGANNVAMYAAKNDDMPAVFAIEDKKTHMPTGASILNGIVASVLVIAAPFIPSPDLFWSFFALNIVTLLIAYIPLFPAFLRLRKIDPKRKRPFKVSGGPTFLYTIVIVPVILLIIAILFSVVPFTGTEAELREKLPLLAGVIVSIVIGEIIAARAGHRSEKSKAK